MRGLNGLSKQNEVKNLILQAKIGVCCLVETKLKSAKYSEVCQRLFQGWCISSNFASIKGGRILMAWNRALFQVQVLDIQDQLIHTHITHISTRVSFIVLLCTPLIIVLRGAPSWLKLKSISNQVRGMWMVVGDFNCPLFPDDRLGSTVRHAKTVDFAECVHYCGLHDMQQVGCRYTWNNKQQGDNRVYSKLDRVLINEEWMANLPDSYVNFLPEGWLDHTPVVIQFDKAVVIGKKPFKFYDMWASHHSFDEIVAKAWQRPVVGTPMFKLVQKLKMLKSDLKELKKSCYSDIKMRYYTARAHVNQVQEELQKKPCDNTLLVKEKELLEEFCDLRKDYTSFLYQKSKMKWIQEGDENTSFFHNSVMIRQYHNKVLSVHDLQGMVHEEPEQISAAFVVTISGA